MAGTSSLLKSAQATQKKIASQQDQLVAFEWENSAQTYDDFLSYSNYLQDRSEKSTDVSDKLTYQTKIRSARRSYTSNELQRQQMAIMEGRASTTDKLAAIKGLYDQAVDNGDLNLAQNLYSQWDALTIKLQNEQEAAMKQYESTLKSGAASANKAIKKLESDLKNGVDDITLPNGQTVTPLAAIADNFQQTGDTAGTLQAAQETLEALKAVIIDQYQNPSATQDQIDTLEQTYGPALSDINNVLTYSPGGKGTKGLSAQQITNAIANEEINNPIYKLEAVRNDATGRNEYQLKENNVSEFDYVRKVDENGDEYFDAVTDENGNPTTIAKATAIRTGEKALFFGESDQGRGVNTQITDEGAVIGDKGQTKLGTENVELKDSQTIGNRLKELGYGVEQNGTTLKIVLPGENAAREATIQPDGSIRFVDDDGQLREVSLVKKNLGTDMLPNIIDPGVARAVSPDEISDFGRQSTFGGVLSRESKQGRRYRESITGGARSTEMINGRSPISIANDFSGNSRIAMGGALQGTSQLLQGSQFTQRAVQQEQQKQQMLQAQQAAALQSTNNFGLNQTPVQQLAANGVLRRQLSVAAPAPTPRIYVAPPAPTSKITSVGVATPTRISSVGVARPQPRVTVR